MIKTHQNNVCRFAAVLLSSGLLTGSFLYALVAGSVLREPSTTYAVLSAMMRPTVPFYITVNTVIEAFLLPLALFLNWNTEPPRRWIVVAAAVVYVVQRIWTYLVYAEGRLATGASPLSEADVEWYKRTLTSEYRIILNAIVFVLFAAAAFPSAMTSVTGVAHLLGFCWVIGHKLEAD